MQITIKLREIREEKRLTQKELVKKSGVSIASIQRIEQNRHTNPSLLVTFKLLDALEVSLDDLIEIQK